ncbi:hypothetical protein OFL77_26955, partial [Escherichia coli]|uniref:hypothetical protein n=1 Tax=Escherichia coli TaxID=562 RepID=UPI0021E0999A
VTFANDTHDETFELNFDKTHLHMGVRVLVDGEFELTDSEEGVYEMVPLMLSVVSNYLTLEDESFRLSMFPVAIETLDDLNLTLPSKALKDH